MKKFFAILITGILYFSLSVNGQDLTWIKTADGQVNCKKITVNGETVKVVLDNGEKQTLPASEVNSYYSDEKLFIKMPCVTNGKKNETFMEFVRTRDEMSLYRFTDSGTYRYIVFKGNEMYQELLDGNTAVFEKFFDVQL